MNFILSQLQTYSPLLLSLFMFLFSYGSVLIFGILWGKQGLYVIIVLLIIAANIQVLKVVQYPMFKSPVALGTELFAATYLATDILVEKFGTKAAHTGVLLGFAGMLFWTIFAVLTIGYAPITQELVIGNEYLASVHDNLTAILRPFPIFLIASLVAYLISQLLDVYIFSWLRQKTNQKHLWLRNNVSTLISALIDNTIFSLLAWIILSANPLPLSVVIKTYILGTYVFRVIAALLDTPMIYLARHLIYTPSNDIRNYYKYS